MINISNYFMKNSALLIMLTAVFIICGIKSYSELNRNEDPGFKIRTASIITNTERLNAVKTDLYVTRQIENYIEKMEEIEDIRSESIDGLSIIYADLYENYKNIRPIWDRLRRKTESAKFSLDKNFTPEINDEYGDVFGALIAVSKKNAPYEELFDLTDNIKDEYQKLNTAGKVEIFGRQNETAYIYFDPSIINNLKLTPDEIINMFNNINTYQGGGKITTGKINLEINPEFKFNTIEDIQNSLIKISNSVIEAKNIFKIIKTTKKPKTKQIKSNGEDCLLIGITLKENGNIIQWGKEIKDKTNELKTKYKNAKIEIIQLQSEYVKKLIGKFTSSLMESIISVIFIVFFILGLKSGLITGFIIFATITSTFFVMKIFNIGLDKISLSALIISLGILVDNSIVMAQGILSKKLNTKEEIKKHITDTAYKFQTPLIIVTLTTSLAFLPVFLAQSTVGEYASNLFKVIFIVLIFSLFYSLSLLPYLMYKFGYKDNVSKREIFLTKYIKEKTEYCFYHPKKTIAYFILIFLFSCILFYFTPKIFFPDSDRSAYEIKLNLKNGASFNETNNAIEKIENYLKNNKNTVNFLSFTGCSAPRYVLSASPENDKTNFGMLLVNIKNYKKLNEEILKAKAFIEKNILNADVIVRKIPLGPPVEAPVEIRIINKNMDELFYFAKIVEDKLKSQKGIYLVKNNWGEKVPEIEIEIDKNACYLAGLNPKYLFDYLYTCYSGLILTYYYRDDIKIPVILKLDEELTQSTEKLNNISIYSKTLAQTIPINQFAKTKINYTRAKILRRNNNYALTVQGWTKGSATAQKIINKIEPQLKNIKKLKYEIGGEIEKSKKGNNSILNKIPLAFGIIFLILTGYFNGIKKPVIIFLCAILGLAGANIGLFITGSYFGFITLLGYVCLIGICADNGVILLSEIKSEAKEDILNAAKSRIEPVLLTCLTTIGGMLPLWLKNDPMFSSLAVAVIFGLISSILITLLFLPALYGLTCEKQRK